MDTGKIKYDIINIAVILLTVVFFACQYWNITYIFSSTNWLSYVPLSFAVIFVHVIKSGRLYLALYGSKVSLPDYLKTYCKVTPVSVVIPFKLGELFRMYCYGVQIGNILKGTVIVLLDRFMDTIALVTLMFVLENFYSGYLTGFVYFLLAVLIFFMLIYFVFPGLYKFWKEYLLISEASERKLAALKILDTFYKIYREIKGVVKGRGIILYVMSLMAWGLEIGSVAFLNRIEGGKETNSVIAAYLSSAVSGRQSLELKQFIFFSVIFLLIVYMVMKAGKIFAGKKAEG